MALCIATLGGCGTTATEYPVKAEVKPVEPGGEVESGTWSCFTDDQGMWDCSGGLVEVRDEDLGMVPERAPIVPPEFEPTLPDVPELEGDDLSALFDPVETPDKVAESPEETVLLAAVETETEPEPELEPEPVAEPVASAAESIPQTAPIGMWRKIDPEGYVLQLAAHTRIEGAGRTLDTLDAPGAEIIATRRGEQTIYVILLGHYPDFESAKLEAESYISRNPGADYWIRSSRDLLKMLP